MVWAPTGDRLLLTLTRNLTERGFEVIGIREYDLTGKPVRLLGEFVGWYDADHLVHQQAGQGTPGFTPKLLIVSMHNTVVRTVALPAPRGHQQVHLGPAAGLTGPAAKLAF